MIILLNYENLVEKFIIKDILGNIVFFCKDFCDVLEFSVNKVKWFWSFDEFILNYF